MALDKYETLSSLLANQMLTVVATYSKLLDNDITAPQYYILRTLANEERMTSSQFASALDVTLSAVTNLSNKLVSKGLVERVAAEHDRRLVYLKITEQGREFERRMLERYKQLTDGLWTEFSEAEIDLLILSYRKMIEHLQANI